MHTWYAPMSLFDLSVVLNVFSDAINSYGVFWLHLKSMDALFKSLGLTNHLLSFTASPPARIFFCKKA